MRNQVWIIYIVFEIKAIGLKSEGGGGQAGGRKETGLGSGRRWHGTQEAKKPVDGWAFPPGHVKYREHCLLVGEW